MGGGGGQPFALPVPDVRPEGEVTLQNWLGAGTTLGAPKYDETVKLPEQSGTQTSE